MQEYRHRDLRDWIAHVDKLGELRRIDGVSWDLDIGGITDVVSHLKPSPAVLFDRIQDYPAGYRVLINQLGSLKRLAYTWGVPDGLSQLGMVQAWREKMRNLKPLPPRVVADGPIMENVFEEPDVNLYRFPAPRWHSHDGGRYIGTSCTVITRDPDDGWVNLGTYRQMIHDETRLGFLINRSRHGRMHIDKYRALGKPCPIAMTFGQEPVLSFLGAYALAPYCSELDYAGGLLGDPVEVIEGELTGLPIPAYAEIAIEGEILPGEEAIEGPFGEFTGYYGSDPRPEPVVHVKRVMHRNDPILTGEPPIRPPSSQTAQRSITISATIWNSLEAAGVPDVKGVWCTEAGATRFFNAIAIKQRYPGHARQAGMIASQCEEGLRLGRYTVVVDDDIDPTNLEQVIWALGTRSDPERDLNIITRSLSGPLDAAVRHVNAATSHSSRAVITACKPFEWYDEFPRTVGLTPDEEAEVLRKFGHLLA